jgi:hypothetical protein
MGQPPQDPYGCSSTVESRYACHISLSTGEGGPASGLRGGQPLARTRRHPGKREHVKQLACGPGQQPLADRAHPEPQEGIL